MVKTYSKFNVSMRNEFPFLKAVQDSESEVLCSLCHGKFSVADGGRTRIKVHLNTQKHIKCSKVVTNNQSLMVQYAFAIPGTSTDVERLFSVINDVWGPDKGQMLPSSLEALLNVKVNSKLNCVEYYESIKNNKKLLAQVKDG
jgi:hypothetical protein